MKEGKYVVPKGAWYQGEWFLSEPLTISYDGLILTLAQYNEKDELQFLILSNEQVEQLKEILSK